jgi:hypothetical protein
MPKSFKVEVLERKRVDEETAQVLLRVTQPKNLDKWLKSWDILETTDDMIEAALMLYLIWKKK